MFVTYCRRLSWRGASDVCLQDDGAIIPVNQLSHIHRLLDLHMNVHYNNWTDRYSVIYTAHWFSSKQMVGSTGSSWKLLIFFPLFADIMGNI